MANFQRRIILGKWQEGFALDLHTLESIFTGYDEFEHPQFITTRSEIGELLYKLKYNGDQSVVGEIADAAATLVKGWQAVEVIVPVPASTRRIAQPVTVLANALGQRLGVAVADCLTTTRDPSPLKNVGDLDERVRLLAGLYAVDPSATTGKRVLLFDDLYRSGATMNEITTTLCRHDACLSVAPKACRGSVAVLETSPLARSPVSIELSVPLLPDPLFEGCRRSPHASRPHVYLIPLAPLGNLADRGR
jgi:competence protein ComFC